MNKSNLKEKERKKEKNRLPGPTERRQYMHANRVEYQHTRVKAK